MPEEDGEVVLPDERIEMRRAEISQAKSEIMEEAQDVGIHAMVKESIESGESERGEVLSALQTPERIDDGITDMNLSNGNSKRIAMGIQSYEGKKDGYFDTVRSSIVANQNLISSSRMQSVSNLNPGQIIAELLVEGEKYTTTTALQVSTCQSNGNPLGHNMQCILTNKRMILVTRPACRENAPMRR